MEIARLSVRNVRVIECADLELDGAPGCIVGPNGSGKTSLLEAVHLLSTGRSFRTRHGRRVLRDGAAVLRVEARLRRGQGAPGRAAFAREGERSRLVLDGERVRSASEAARALPVTVLRPESHRLIEGGSRERRALLDWTLFHVEQGYVDAYRRFRRALEQRNRALREGDRRHLRVWTETLASSGEQLEALREPHARAYVERLRERLATVLDRPVEVTYARGWVAERDLEACLGEHLEQDLRAGATGIGPHRADLRLRVGAFEARQVLSRGEAKLLAGAMVGSQVEYVAAVSGEAPLLLLDDLTSELDAMTSQRLLDLVGSLPGQVILTAIGPLELDLSVLSQVRVFHVERGRIRDPMG